MSLEIVNAANPQHLALPVYHNSAVITVNVTVLKSANRSVTLWEICSTPRNFIVTVDNEIGLKVK